VAGRVGVGSHRLCGGRGVASDRVSKSRPQGTDTPTLEGLMTTLPRLLKESWTLVEDRADHLANYFYARLFLTDPNLRDMFPVQMTAQRSRLLGALVEAVQTVDDPSKFDAYLGALGKDHRKFHVSPEQYGAVGTALIDALRTYAGDRWTAEYEQAWHDGYDAIATRMLTGAAGDNHKPAFWHAEVLSHERRGKGDVAVFTCRPLSKYDFTAGQYASLECQHQPRLWRSYSIANAPCADGTLEFHVRAPSIGWVSAALVRKLRVGDMIRVGPPTGTMTLDRQSTRDIVCVAGGTGLSPIKSLIEEYTRNNRTRWVHLFIGAKDHEDFYDEPALRHLAGRYRRLSVVTACSNDPAYPGEQGNICDVVERYGPWREHDFFVCGPPPMLNATLAALAGMDVPPSRIRYDAMPDLPEHAQHDCRSEPPRRQDTGARKSTAGAKRSKRSPGIPSP
jgi:NAD(P)H-flavin reductase/hemoglobin-like flavoprotein